jgi:hypothetical protein
MRLIRDLALLFLTAWLAAAQGTAQTGINLNKSTPAAPSGSRNVTFQNDASAPTRNMSAYVTYPTVQVACPSGSDLSTAVNACLASLPTPTGGICDARACSANFTWNNPTTFSNPNQALLLPCGTLTATATVTVSPTVRNSTIHGCAYQGGSAGSGTAGGSVWNYQGNGTAFVIGDTGDGSDTPGFYLTDLTLATANGGSSAHAIDFHRVQEIDIERVYFIGNNGTGQTGITLDGTGNYSGGTFQSFRLSNFGTALLMTGNGTGAANASTFTRMHVNCPTSGGSPISGGIGINLAYGDGNTFVGGDIEGCDTMLSLGAGASNNTFNGVRNENSNSQVVAASGSQYNLWLTGGTMFTGKLTDAGTHNSFADTFHRSWNNLNGDLWRSQSDATITNRVYTGIGLGHVRGRIQEWQTDVPGSPGTYQNAWQWGPGDGTSGAQVWQLLDMINSVPRWGAIQYTTAGGNNQTFLNGAGTGAVCVQCSTGAGSGGFVVGSGGPTITTVASIGNTGNTYLAGTLSTGGTATFGGSTNVRNQADAEIDSFLQAGLTTGQKESFTYRDYTGASQWFMINSTTNDWALNSSPGTIDSFKAYQSTNSGDTYVNAQKSTGVVRVNYETNSGTGFAVYGGNSTTVYAAFTGSTSIRFPGFATSSGHNCLQIDNSGYISNTGTACGTGSGSGSVTSVGLSLPAQFNVSGSPVTGSGTLTANWANETAAYFFAGPTSGPGTTPTFRAITATDVPTLNQSTSGNAATAAASDHSPTQCSSGLYSQGDTTGWAANCATVQYSQLGGTVPTWNQSTTGNAATATTTTGNAATATALAATPGQCSSGNYATGIAAAGTANCGAVQYSQLGGTVTTWNQNTTGTAAGITQAASIHIDNSAGANYVCINCDNNTGTSGFVVQNGTGSSPTTEFQVTGSGNTTATGFLASQGWFGNYAATFTAGAAAGSSPTIGCLSGHTCTNIQGTVSIHTGTATTTGTIVTVNFNHTQNHDLDCATDFQLAGTGHLTTYDATSSTSGLVIATDGFTPAASTTYTLTYTCGSY